MYPFSKNIIIHIVLRKMLLSALIKMAQNKVRIGFADNINDVEYVKSDMFEQKNSGNPVRLYFVLETPIETDLTAEEIAAYQSLHTYTPNTSVGNDADACG